MRSGSCACGATGTLLCVLGKGGQADLCHPSRNVSATLSFPRLFAFAGTSYGCAVLLYFLMNQGFFSYYVYLRGAGGDKKHRVWSEDNLRESGFSFHHTGPGDRTQVSKLGCKRLYLMSHLDDSLALFSDSNGRVLLCSPRWPLTRDSVSTSRDS